MVNEHVTPAQQYTNTHTNTSVLATNYELGGNCCIIKLSNRTAQENLEHYLRCKVLKPESTSAIILVPRTQRTRKLRKLLVRMTQGTTIPPGNNTLIGANGKPIANTCPIDVFVDRPGTTHQRLSNINDNLTFKLQGVVSNTKAVVLLDTGATGCFVSQSFVQKIGLHVDQPTKAVEVEVASGDRIKAAGTCRMHLRLQGTKSILNAEVLPKFIPDVDIVLGESWLKEHRAKICFDTNTCVVQTRRGHEVLQGKHNTPRKSNTKDPLEPKHYVLRAFRQGQQVKISHARQVLSVIRQGGHGLLVHMSPSDDTGSSPTRGNVGLNEAGNGSGPANPGTIEQLLDAFKDVFQDLPPGLPSDRGTGHCINLEPDAKPAYRPIYRLSPVELNELKK